jgi:ferredoxin-type protein NapH
VVNTVIIIAILLAIVLIVRKWTVPARGFVQLSSFIIGEIAFACNKGATCANCPLSFGFCPVGTTQRIGFIKVFPVYLTLIVIAAIGFIFGTLGCGWACPIGFLQDFLHAGGVREIKISNNLRIIRWLSLLIVVVLFFLELHYGLLSSRGIGVFHEFAIIAGCLFLLTAILVKRPFCRVLCPLGLVYGLMNKISPVKVRLDKDKCTVCLRCAEVCVSSLNPAEEVNTDLCVKCFNCRRECNRLK